MAEPARAPEQGRVVWQCVHCLTTFATPPGLPSLSEKYRHGKCPGCNRDSAFREAPYVAPSVSPLRPVK